VGERWEKQRHKKWGRQCERCERCERARVCTQIGNASATKTDTSPSELNPLHTLIVAWWVRLNLAGSPIEQHHAQASSHAHPYHLCASGAWPSTRPQPLHHAAKRCNSLSAFKVQRVCRSCASEFAPHARYTTPSSRQSELLWQMNAGHAVQRHTGPQVHDMLCSLLTVDTCIQRCCFVNVSLTLKGKRADRAHISRTHTNLPRARIAIVLLHPQRSTPATRRQEANVLSAHVVSPCLAFQSDWF
jgi:hypothetical protein